MQLIVIIDTILKRSLHYKIDCFFPNSCISRFYWCHVLAKFVICNSRYSKNLSTWFEVGNKQPCFNWFLSFSAFVNFSRFIYSAIEFFDSLVSMRLRVTFCSMPPRHHILLLRVYRAFSLGFSAMSLAES